MNTFIISFRFQGNSKIGTKIKTSCSLYEVLKGEITSNTELDSNSRRERFLKQIGEVFGEDKFQEDPCTSLVLVKSTDTLEGVVKKIFEKFIFGPKDHIVILQSGRLGGYRIMNEEIRKTEDISNWISGNY